MKIYGSILALCAVQPIAAFVVPGQKAVAFRGRALNSMPPPPPPPPGAGPPNPANPNSDVAAVTSGNAPERVVSGGYGAALASSSGPGGSKITNIWDSLAPVRVQGDTLRTWSFESVAVERVQVLMKTGGRPLNADVELWQGPDNTPQRMGVYVEDGSLRSFCAVVETPRGSNAIAIRNTNPMEFPLDACVEADDGTSGLGALTKSLADKSGRTVQGGAVYTEPFAPAVESVSVVLKTDGRPLNARIELLQGPNNNKQVMEIYTEDGMERPFLVVIETPGTGNVVRIVNTATVEYPLTASLEPFVVSRP